ncbi:MAG: 4Fe-4S binding protein, partial [Prevotella sp.]|nr:4Fe-4S binding protein [Prevotella sp.]
MKKSEKHPQFSPRNCTACWKCVEVCPKRAIHKVGFLWHKHAKPFHYHCCGCNLCVEA